MTLLPRSRFAPAMVAALSGALACSGPPSDAEETARTQQPGVYGVYYLVNVSKPTGGRIVSTDGQVDCGTNATKCGPARFNWNVTATFNAVPDPGNMLGTWAGDCQYRGSCVLSTKPYGADKFIVAVFGPVGLVQHGNFTNKSIHGPEYLDFLGGRPDAFRCNAASCHGTTLAGVGIAPGCRNCHVSAGWTSWQTNCSFCHGLSSSQTKPGYSFAANPAWAAPPHSTKQRLTGVAAPDRTGAHQAHLLGVTAGGARFAAAVPCATCHAVPTTLTHVQGSQTRATVALAGVQAGLPADLGSYDPATGTCLTYCHGPQRSPAWSNTGLQCGSCHGLPPAGHLALDAGTSCAVCHPATVRADGTLDLAGGKHLDGVVQTDMGAAGTSCSTCHGGGSPASPHLTAGATLADCRACHPGDGHPLPSGAMVPETACLACHADRG